MVEDGQRRHTEGEQRHQRDGDMRRLVLGMRCRGRGVEDAVTAHGIDHPPAGIDAGLRQSAKKLIIAPSDSGTCSIGTCASCAMVLSGASSLSRVVE